MKHFLIPQKETPAYLFFITLILCFAFLGTHLLWTMENRWADVVLHMLYTKDYWHPYIEDHPYFDKPILSYWLMITAAKITHGLSATALRLPSAISALVSVFCLYKLGALLHSKRLGSIAAWLLISSFYFIFWARVASADMLTLTGVLLAITWYAHTKTHLRFRSYCIFFIICALTSLCKGLLGFVLPLLAILPDVLHEKSLLKHLRFSFFVSLAIGLLIYLAPFLIATYTEPASYNESGLYEVFRENILRFVAPFDHTAPVSTYFIAYAVYLLPWTLFFIPAVISLPKRWRHLPWSARWMCWTTALLFLFFSLSLSRRSYYILPVLPYGILITAQWIEEGMEKLRARLACILLTLALAFSFCVYIILMPLYYGAGGVKTLVKQTHLAAQSIAPLEQWDFTMMDTDGSATFYFHPARIPSYMSPADVAHIASKPQHMIYVTRLRYLSTIQPYFKNYQILTAPLMRGERFLHQSNQDRLVVLIPSIQLRTTNEPT